MSVLEGLRVLLVEDESLVAMLAEDILLDLGCEVVVAMRLEQALAAARTDRFDLAVLDVNLGATRSYPVADVLSARCIPFLFATGYGLSGLERDYEDVPVVQKPYQPEQMALLLTHLMRCADTPRASRRPSRPLACTCGLGFGSVSASGERPGGPVRYRAEPA